MQHMLQCKLLVSSCCSESNNAFKPLSNNKLFFNLHDGVDHLNKFEKEVPTQSDTLTQFNVY